MRGLRVTGFYDKDAYVKDAERRRGVFAADLRARRTSNAAFDYLWASDQTRVDQPEARLATASRSG